MPLFTYFALAGPLLLGLLFAAEAQLGPPKELAISTSFHGLPAPFKAQKSVTILTVREAPAPLIRDVVADAPIMAQATEERPVQSPKKNAKKSKKIAKIPHHGQFARAPWQSGAVVW